MTLHSGREGYAVICTQASPATPADLSGGVFIPYTGFDWDSKPDRSYETEHRKNTDKNHPPITSSVTTEGSFSFPAYNAGGLEHAFYGIFGSYTATTYSSTPAYGYTYAQASTVPIFSLGNGLGTLNYKKFSDAAFKSLKLEAKNKEKLDVTVEGFSYMMDISGSALTPSYTSNNALNFSDFSITYDGATASNILNASITIDRGTTAYYTAGHGLNYGLQNAPYFACHGTFEAFFENYSDYVTDWMGGSTTFDDSPVNSPLVFTWTGDLLTGTADKYNSLVLTLPKVYLDEIPLKYSGDEAVKSVCSFTAVYSSADSKTASALIQSNLASIV